MTENKIKVSPELELLYSIIAQELKGEEDAELKELVKRKAQNLYPLLSLLGTKDLDDEEMKKKIKSLVEEV